MGSGGRGGLRKRVVRGRPSNREEPSSRLMRHGSPARVGSGQRVGANGESGCETPDHDAPATIGKRTRKGEEAQETGHGSSGWESSGGQFQGRERHETRPRSAGGFGKRRASQGVRARRDDQPEPSRGARTLRTAPTGVWQPPSARPTRVGLDDKGAPDVVAFVGARTSREAVPPPESHLVRSRGSGRRTEGAGKLWQLLSKECRTPGEDLAGTCSCGSGTLRKTARPFRTARRERWKPARRYSAGRRNLCRGR